MKKLLTILLLALSMTVWSQIELTLNENTNVIASANFCIALTEYGDSIVKLQCSDIYIELPMENLKHEQYIIIITPNSKRDSVYLDKYALNFYLTEEDNHKFNK